MSQNIIKKEELPEGYRIKIKHLHEGNVGKKLLMGARYATVAEVEDDKRNVIATATAICGKRDNPSRKLGRQIAVGRALKKYTELKSNHGGD
jgi:hypothetical protein